MLIPGVDRNICQPLCFILHAPSSISEAKIKVMTLKGTTYENKYFWSPSMLLILLENMLTKKFAKSPPISLSIALDIIIAKEHGEYQVELITNYEGSRISASGTDEVMYPTIKAASKKLDAALKHRKVS